MENEYAFSKNLHFLSILELWDFKSYGVSKKILHQEMHEWKIAWKTSLYGSKIGDCFMITHGAWFEFSKMIPRCFTCEYYVGIKETWLENIWVKFECFRARFDCLIVFSIAWVTWIFDIFRHFKMDARDFQYIYKSLKLIIEALEDYLMMKKRDCFGNKQNSFLKTVFMLVRLWRIAWQGY